MRRALFIPLTLAVAASGCVHVSREVVVDRSDQPVPREQVRVYDRGDEVPEECELVAYLHASASEDFSDRDQVVDRFREKAGGLGANAVTVREMWGRSRRTSILDSPAGREFDAEAFWCAREAGGTGR